MEEKDPPIEPLNYMSGPTVIDIGDIRVARGMSRRPASACKHRHMRYDRNERRVWCVDCERDIEGFDAFQLLAEQAHEFAAHLDRREKKIAEAEAFQVRSLAAKEIDKVWRSRTRVPACPHCHLGLLPEHFAKGVTSQLGRDYAIAQIRAKNERKP